MVFAIRRIISAESVSGSAETPVRNQTLSADLVAKTTRLEAITGYRIVENGCTSLDLFAGAVYYDIDNELGIPGNRRQELHTQSDYDALFAIYRHEDLPTMRPAIRALGRLLDEYGRIALTCFEKEHQCCHRHCVADEMKRLIRGCPPPVHI